MPPQRPSVRSTLRARFDRTTLVLAGVAAFDVLIWTAAAIVH